MMTKIVIFFSSGSGDSDGSESDSNRSESDGMAMARYFFHSYFGFYSNLSFSFSFSDRLHAPFENGAAYQMTLQVSRLYQWMTNHDDNEQTVANTSMPHYIITSYTSQRRAMTWDERVFPNGRHSVYTCSYACARNSSFYILFCCEYLNGL
jgi:hypothetical protein